MELVERIWNGHFIQVEEEWLERAKELIREHGITEVHKITEILEEEMSLPPFSSHVSKLFVIAERETAPERSNP